MKIFSLVILAAVASVASAASLEGNSLRGSEQTERTLRNDDFVECMQYCNLIDGKSFGYLSAADVCQEYEAGAPNTVAPDFGACVQALVEEGCKGIGEYCSKECKSLLPLP